MRSKRCRGPDLMGSKWLANMFDCNPTAKENRFRDACIHTCMVTLRTYGEVLRLSVCAFPSRIWCVLSRSTSLLQGDMRISVPGQHSLQRSTHPFISWGLLFSWVLGSPTACVPENFLPPSVPTRKETKQNTGNRTKIKSQ